MYQCNRFRKKLDYCSLMNSLRAFNSISAALLLLHQPSTIQASEKDEYSSLATIIQHEPKPLIGIKESISSGDKPRFRKLLPAGAKGSKTSQPVQDKKPGGKRGTSKQSSDRKPDDSSDTMDTKRYVHRVRNQFEAICTKHSDSKKKMASYKELMKVQAQKTPAQQELASQILWYQTSDRKQPER